VEVLVHARRLGLVVLISNVFAYHLRVQEAITANAAMPLVAGEDVRPPLGAFRVVFGIGHFNNPSLPEIDDIGQIMSKHNRPKRCCANIEQHQQNAYQYSLDNIPDACPPVIGTEQY